GTSGSVIFNKESERLYNDITRRYAFAYEQKEKVRYEKDEWVQKVVQRFTEAANETELSKVYDRRSEEHTSELQSRFDLVCRLLRYQTRSIRFPYTTLFRSWNKWKCYI